MSGWNPKDKMQVVIGGLLGVGPIINANSAQWGCGKQSSSTFDEVFCSIYIRKMGLATKHFDKGVPAIADNELGICEVCRRQIWVEPEGRNHKSTC